MKFEQYVTFSRKSENELHGGSTWLDRAQVQEASLISFQSVNNLTTVNLLTLCKRANSWESISVQDTLSPLFNSRPDKAPIFHPGAETTQRAPPCEQRRSKRRFTLIAIILTHLSREWGGRSKTVQIRSHFSWTEDQGKFIHKIFSDGVVSIGLLNTRYSIFGRF